MVRSQFPCVSAVAALLSAAALTASGQTIPTTFTYQGELLTSGVPAEGLHDLRFRLFDASNGGVQVGPTLCVNDVSMSAGQFTVELDFGSSVFKGGARFVEIEARADFGQPCADPSGFVALSPRQPVTTTPIAQVALETLSGSPAHVQLQNPAGPFITIPPGGSSGTVVSWPTVVANTSGTALFDAASPTRLKASQTGQYLLNFRGIVANGAGGQIVVARLLKNGAIVGEQSWNADTSGAVTSVPNAAATDNSRSVSGTWVLSLNQGDYVELFLSAHVSSNGALGALQMRECNITHTLLNVGREGPAGPQGPQGPAGGPTGPTGPAGPTTWTGLTDIPAGFADGVDNDTTYTAGTGLLLTGNTFSFSTVFGDNRYLPLTANFAGDVSGPVNLIRVNALRSVGISAATPTNGQVLRLNSGVWTPTTLDWSMLAGIPAGFADNTDNDTTYVAGSGLTLTGNSFSFNNAFGDLRYLRYASPFTGGDIAGTLAAPSVTALRGVPIESTATPFTGQVLKFDGQRWGFAQDINTTYAAGNGLLLNIPESGPEFILNFSLLDSRYLPIGQLLSGDVVGAPGSTQVVALAGLPLELGVPPAGKIYKWNGSQWAFADDANDTTIANWPSLLNVPAGFADNIDNDTIYSVTSGLTLAGTTLGFDTAFGDARYLRGSNTLGGDLSGTILAPTVSAIRGTPVSVTAPSSGQVLKFNGSSWVPSADLNDTTTALWTSIGGIPADFADNVDNDTTYSAGPGLTLSGTTLFFDTTFGDNRYILPSTAISGDLSGSFGAPSVTSLRGRPLGLTVPANGQVLKFNGAQWVPAADNNDTTSAAWANISGVPAGFSDNIDNDTTYAAGTGLSMVGTTIGFDTTFGDARYVRPSTPLAGDLSGTLASASVLSLRGTPVSSVSPTSGQVLLYDGVQWRGGALPAASISSNQLANDVASLSRVSNGIMTAASPGSVGIGTNVPTAVLAIAGGSPSLPVLETIPAFGADLVLRSGNADHASSAIAGQIGLIAGEGSAGTSSALRTGGAVLVSSGAGAPAGIGSAGVGGPMTIRSGDGGDSAGATPGASAGTLSITSGAGGNSATGLTGGGGTILVDAGNGGAGTSSSGAFGGSIFVSAGDGGSSGTSTGGDGGSITISSGLGGNGTTPGLDGSITLQSGTGGVRVNGVFRQVSSASGSTAFTSSSASFDRNSTNYVSILSPDANERGVAFGSPASNLHGGVYYRNSNGMLFRTGGGSERMVIEPTGNIGIGTFTRSVDARLHIQSDSDRVLKVDRFTTDGELLAWARDDAVVGSVAVAGGVVTYGAFTGVHYAEVDAVPEPGTIMALTGVDTRLGGRADGEVVYKVVPVSRANEPAALGSFVSMLPGGSFKHPKDIAQIAAVGNADMWIVDTGKDILPGDPLITSDTPGCAMLDDPSRFASGNVIAKAAQVIRWDSISADKSGLKRAKISVLLTSYQRSSSEQVVVSPADSATVESLVQENRELRQLLLDLKSRMDAMDSLKAGAK